ncbi:Lrp/AsnC ligand binding domain-containing protein [Heyndrickxia sporothermodurans]
MQINYLPVIRCCIASLHRFLDNLEHKPFLNFLDQQEPYIMHNYTISGEGCYLLECRFPSNNELDMFLTKLTNHANYKLSIVINRG